MNVDEMASIEVRKLEEAMRTQAIVKLFFVNGFATEARIEDFDCEVIVARVKDREWIVYRHALSTIVMP